MYISFVRHAILCSTKNMWEIYGTFKYPLSNDIAGLRIKWHRYRLTSEVRMTAILALLMARN
jgi:hypothetical protein